MASVDTGGEQKKRGKPTKLNLRVDFTPMVDMNMLLLTFFMFCTTLSKPQIMDIAMPTDDKENKLDEDEKNKVPDDQTITILLGEDNKVYYYEGKANYEDYSVLKETTFAAEGGIRDVLLKKNEKAVREMIALKRERRDNKRMTDEDFNDKAKEIRNDDKNTIVVIKATDDSRYANLVDALDEMAICSIGKYAIVNLADGDEFMMENYKTKGAYGEEHKEPSGKKK